MDQEFGVCDVCGEESVLGRTYFHYDLKCECHSPNHFEIAKHCHTCIPKEPVKTVVYLKPIKK